MIVGLFDVAWLRCDELQLLLCAQRMHAFGGV